MGVRYFFSLVWGGERRGGEGRSHYTIIGPEVKYQLKLLNVVVFIKVS